MFLCVKRFMTRLTPPVTDPITTYIIIVQKNRSRIHVRSQIRNNTTPSAEKIRPVRIYAFMGMPILYIFVVALVKEGGNNRQAIISAFFYDNIKDEAQLG